MRLPVFRRRLVFESLDRPRLGERAERYAASQSRPRSGNVLLVSALSLGCGHKIGGAGARTPRRPDQEVRPS